jgi:hypothetical protein
MVSRERVTYRAFDLKQNVGMSEVLMFNDLTIWIRIDQAADIDEIAQHDPHFEAILKHVRLGNQSIPYEMVRNSRFDVVGGKIYYSVPRGEFKLMQCTGLRDCLGNLIYEGDIVKLNDSPVGLYQVEWQIAYARFVFKSTTCDGVYQDFGLVDQEPIVVGNIYEQEEEKTETEEKEIE